MRKVIIIDFGSQYTLLIARELRRIHVYCEVQILNSILLDQLKHYTHYIDALILSGGPHSVSQYSPLITEFMQFLQENAKLKWVDGKRKKQKAIPILGICFGAQLLAKTFGAQVVTSNNNREYGESWLKITSKNHIFSDLPDITKVWMSHNDSILVTKDLNKIKVLARPRIDRDEVAVFQIIDHGIHVPMFGFQFHPEVSHTSNGPLWLRNFCLLSDVEFSWYPDAFIQQTISNIRHQTKLKHNVLVACSGGVDSTVMAVLLNLALGDRCQCVFLNNGLLRAGEFEEIYDIYKHLGLNIQGVDCATHFFQELVGVIDPEQKRKVIGRVFIEEFIKFINSDPKNFHFLAQGTIYPDVVESHGKIKSHHNVGGLPQKLHLELIEPLRSLFKDEVRQIGKQLGIPPIILDRHPFPGPGLGIRILGEVNLERVKILQEADRIYIEMLKQNDYYQQIWQAGAVLLDCKSVGVMGDKRTYESVVGLRAVCSVNGMTADVFEFPVSFLGQVATRIVNEVVGVNRVVYDVTSKPPGTIEWE